MHLFIDGFRVGMLGEDDVVVWMVKEVQRRNVAEERSGPLSVCLC